MATTKIKPIKKRLDHVINYAGNEEKVFNDEYGKTIVEYQDLHDVLEYAENDFKTEKRLYVTGINCIAEDAYNDMQITKQNYKKNGGILGYHIIQSFNEGEVTPELAHKIGVELCNELFGDRFEVVVATHLNTNHYHNHIVLNSVSFVDGKKYYDNHETYSLIRRTSDNICKEYGLSVLEEKPTQNTNINYNNFYNKYSHEHNYKNTAKKDLDHAISLAYSFEDFKTLMKKMGYEIIFRSGKISIKGKDYNRNIRIERAFGEKYSIDNIKLRILSNDKTNIQSDNVYKLKKPNYANKNKYTKKKAKGLVALFYHYCYLLKIFPSQKNVHKKLSANMRADINKMEQYSEDARFLAKEKINTTTELKEYKEKLCKEIKEITAEREKLWKSIKNLNETDKTNTYSVISELNSDLKLKRKEMKLCEDIEFRKQKIKENLQEMNDLNNNKNGKERKNERF